MMFILFYPGTPCNKMTGYCDVFYRCRGVDPDTPLVRLKNCITSGKCATIFKDFLQVYTDTERNRLTTEPAVTCSF